MTYWKINVHYYLKGDQESSDFYVVTPGAENKWTKTSLDFRLDQWGKTVILFLRARDKTYEPLSSQGIIDVDKTDYVRKADEPLNGILVLKEFKLGNENNSELEEFILNDSLVTISKNVLSKQQVPKRSIIPLIIGSLVFVALILGLITFIRNRSAKEK
jgi:hypothetical protein